MAERSDDKSANWREKYLDALDQQEQMEASLGAQQELLRRALVRVSLAADGQNDDLDALLSQVRERMRGSINGDINSLLAQLDEAVLNFDHYRAQNAQTVRQALSDTLKPLQTLEPSRRLKHNISQYLDQLPERSKKMYLYPALLQQLADIQQQVFAEFDQPKTGFFQKLLARKSTAEPAPLALNNSPISADSLTTPETEPEPETKTETPASSTTAHTASDSWAETATLAPASDRFAPNPLASSDLPQQFVAQITQVINQFLVGLEQETPAAKKVAAIRTRLNAATSADAFIKTLEELRDLVMQAYLSANQAFASYLNAVNHELSDIYSALGGAVASESSRRAASADLQTSMRQGMQKLAEHTEAATDLAQLKSSVQSQIGNIRQALDNYQQGEQAQNQLASQLDALANKIKIMEADAEKNRSMLEKQRHKALHDPLTELPNREYYNERAHAEYQRWQRYQRPLTLAVFDIDHFKKINDGHGHQAGDRVLKVIGRSIAKRLREVDFFCRFGGEEFVALMPETSVADAMPLLDKIRTAIANAAFNYQEQPIAITLSIGATELKAGDSLESAFARADGALYAAKAGGRNCLKTA